MQNMNFHRFLSSIMTFAFAVCALFADEIHFAAQASVLSRKIRHKVANGRVLKQTDRENNLVYLMKTNLLKRLESSVHSFSLTLQSIIEQIDAYLSKIENEATNIGDFDNIDMEDDEMEEAFVGAKVKIALRDIDRIRWKQDLLYDRTILQKLLDYASQVTPERDQKC